VPQLGVVKLDEWVGADPGETMVMADIPGLVPGASEGAGLGIRFLRHVHRTRVLLHLVSLDPDEERDPVKDYEVIRKELEQFDTDLAERPEVVAISKSDLTDVQESIEDIQARFKEKGIDTLVMSAPTRQGVKEVIEAIRTRMLPVEESF